MKTQGEFYPNMLEDGRIMYTRRHNLYERKTMKDSTQKVSLETLLYLDAERSKRLKEGKKTNYKALIAEAVEKAFT